MEGFTLISIIVIVKWKIEFILVNIDKQNWKWKARNTNQTYLKMIDTNFKSGFPFSAKPLIQCNLNVRSILQYTILIA